MSLAEMAVIAIVALLVLGPERLPKAARTVGFYVRKARQSWYSVRSEF
jgi:sec-independent protein translocase protein TatB